MKERALIDKVVNWRKDHRAWDQSPLRVNLNPEALHKALSLPAPPNGEAYPDSVMYRGFRLLAKKPDA